MTERDALTAHIRSMYEEFPFPNCAYRRKQGLELGVYLARAARAGSRSLLAEGVSVLDGGCGTGSTILPLARAYPGSQFVGLDMNGPSLEIAERDARALGLTNIRFAQGDLHTVELGQKFDVVLSFGVLIVMADPDAGLARLAAHLAPGGRMVLWLYGSHGRYRLQLNQRMLAILSEGAASWGERAAIARQALRGLPRRHLECYLSAPTDALERDFGGALDWALEHDAWLADQFLHPNERSYDLDGILAALDRAGLRLEGWLGVDLDVTRHTDDDELRRRVAALSERDRLRFFDLLLKPVDYFVAARHAAEV